MTAISVIIPAYNQAHYLAAAIQSVLDQTFFDFEILVINDGSTDQTGQVVTGFKDRRIYYYYQENKGLSAARNTGIRHAIGKYITFLDADDLFLPEKLACEVALFAGDPKLGFVAGQAIMIDSIGKSLGLMSPETLPDDPIKLLMGNPLHVGSVLVRREWLEQVGPFGESLRACEDWDMWLRLAQAGCPMKGLAVPVSQYRVHPAQMTRGAERMRTASLAVLDKFFRQESLPENWRALKNEAYAAAYVRSAARSYHANLTELAKRDLSQAASLNPRLLDCSGSRLIKTLAGWADAPMVPNPLEYLERVFANLPDDLAILRKNRRPRLSAMALDMAYRQMEQNHGDKAGYYFFLAARYQPKILINRGHLVTLARFYLDSWKTVLNS